MTTSKGYRVLLGVTGGIAAYKSAELVRLLRQTGAEVRVAMTLAAERFVGATTFQALSGHRVYGDLWASDAPEGMPHIELARWPDVVLIAPATANFLAKLRVGQADDLMLAVCLATETPVFVAPAMNQAMWLNPATQENIKILRDRGIRVLGPSAGSQACGDHGPGRMLEPEELCAAINASHHAGPLRGVPVLITAGPTQEAIDPVRYITNRSSGKMGYALAAAARDRGANVTLVSGPTALSTPSGIQTVHVRSAAEMFEAVMSHIDAQAIFIAAAAVADYTPSAPATGKIKKSASELSIALSPTRDIIATVGAQPQRPFMVGFAAETADLERYARAKLNAKNLDMIAANWVGAEHSGFEVDTNELDVYWPSGHCHLACAPKSRIAAQLLDLIAERYHAKHQAEDPR